MPPTERSFVLLGNSHLHALVLAAKATAITFRAVRIDKLGDRPLANLHGKLKLSSTLRTAVEQAAAELRDPLVASCIGGNVHNLLAFVNFDRRFDFVLSEQPDLPLDQTAESIPEEAILDSIKFRARGQISLLKCLAEEIDGRVVHAESPPPNGDNRYCVRRIPAHLRGPIAAKGMASPMLRYKMWRLHSRIFRHACEEAGIQFVPAPPASMDGSGFLVRDFYGNATHANERYGELVIRQLEAL